MQKNRKAQGFTLIELLIVIAIIGILAAVLIPNLLGARTAAQRRSLQAHSANVYKAVYGFMSSGPASRDATATLGATGLNTAVCVNALTPSTATENFGWKAAPAGTNTCTITAVGTDDFSVRIVSNAIGGTIYTFDNGEQVSAVAGS